MATVKIHVHSDFEGDYNPLINGIHNVAESTERMIAFILGSPEEMEKYRIQLLQNYIRLGGLIYKYAGNDFNDPST